MSIFTLVCPIGNGLRAAVAVAWAACSVGFGGYIHASKQPAYDAASKALQRHVQSCPICRG